MNPIPRFILGDSVSIRINGTTVLGTISPYINGVMVIHSNSLRNAHERDFTRLTRRGYDRYSADGQLYAEFLGNDMYYVVTLSNGEKIIKTERNIVMMMGNEALRRNIRNSQSRRSMSEFLTGRPNDTRPYLPDNLNYNIMLYLIETPLSTNINTRIQDRLNPPTPSTVHVRTTEENDAQMRSATRFWNASNNREREAARMIEEKRERDERDMIQRQANNLIKAKEAREWYADTRKG